MRPTSRNRRALPRRGSLVGFAVVLGVAALVTTNVAVAAEAPVVLGTAESFAVLAGAGVTNTGPTVVNGDLGTSPTATISGFPPGVVNGTIHAADTVAGQAKSDLTTGYNDAAGRAPTTTYTGPTELGGSTLLAGVYKSPTSFAITGTLTLDAQGNPDAVFIFQAGSTLDTAVNSQVSLVNGTQACNVFWQVGSSATLGVGSSFVGTILALASITANTNAIVSGRLLARNGATTLDSNTITRAPCAAVTTTTTSETTTTSSTLPGATTTLPGATTTLPGATTTIGPTTTAPGATTTTTEAVTPTTRLRGGGGGGGGGGGTGGTRTTAPRLVTSTTSRTSTTAGTRSTTSTTTIASGVQPTTTTSTTSPAGGISSTGATPAVLQPETLGAPDAANAASPGATLNSARDRKLAVTGTPTNDWSRTGGLAIAAGSVLVLASRRRRQPDNSLGGAH